MSQPDTEPRTEAGRRFLEDLTKEHCSDPHGCHAADDSLAGMAVLAIEAEAAARLTAYQEAWLDEHVALDAARIAESGRLREALLRLHGGFAFTEDSPSRHLHPPDAARYPACEFCRLLATPPARSDHGAGERDEDDLDLGWTLSIPPETP